MPKRNDEKKNLYKYLFSRFLLTLILVGISQMVINLVLRFFLVNYVESFLGVDGILTGKGISEVIGILISSVVIVLIRMIFDSGLIAEGIENSNLLRQIFGDDFFDGITLINGQSANSSSLRPLIIVLLFLALMLLWILPYVVGAICYSKNVSKKTAEIEAARVAREKEYERSRNLLLSDITHDIKTPLTTVAGFSKALCDGEVAENQQKEYLDSIYNKSMKISELVSLLFEYIKLDSAGYVLNKCEVDIAEFLRECIAGMYAEFEDADFNLNIDIPDEKIPVLIDRMQMERVISNLLTNTLKYNPSGTNVDVRLRRENQEVVIDISDNGVRIEREDAIHLFEPFYRTDKSRKSGRGNGLGLSIAKKIVEMHDGKIYLIQYRNSQKHGKVKIFEIRLNCT